MNIKDILLKLNYKLVFFWKSLFKFTKKHISILEIILVFISSIISTFSLFIAYKTYIIAIPAYYEFIEKNEIPNINWNWNLEFITEKSNVKEYIWMNDQYDVFWIWSKDQYKWKWEKWKSYWNFIEHEKRKKIDFEIIIKNWIMYWFYNFYWSREISWDFEVKLNKDWTKFEWIFRTSWADSSWKIIWIKK